jgi:tRNA A-37 threonylcarbamoyl transferase component Bud32
LIIVRNELEAYLDPDRFVKQATPQNEESSLYGRGGLYLIQMSNGEAVVVRPYRHGGCFRHLTGGLFFTWPPRPFRELAITEEARRRGLRTSVVCGAWVKRAWGPFYRGWLITRELADAQDLWEVLQKGLYGGADGKLLLQAVAQSVREMHRRGIYHRDLNLKNIMVRRDKDEITTYIIDFDKAKMFPGEVPPEKAQKNLRRLLRSICKLDPDRRHLSQRNWDQFVQFYTEAVEA